MILEKRQKQVNKIREYIMKNSRVFDKLVIFGEATDDDYPEEAEKDVYLDVAVKTVRDEDATDDDILFELISEIDEVTGGRFHLIIMNDTNVTSNVLHNIEKGVVVYDATV